MLGANEHRLASSSRRNGSNRAGFGLGIAGYRLAFDCRSKKLLIRAASFIFFLIESHGIARTKNKMRTTFLFAALASALLLLSAAIARAGTDAELSRKILGTWWERTHEVTYLKNGKWTLSKELEPGKRTYSPGVFRWHVKNGKLIEFRDGVTYPAEKIVWVNPNEFYLLDEHGAQSAHYYRHVETH